MVTSDSGLTDEVFAELNPAGETAEEYAARVAAQSPPLPSRPEYDAPDADWLAYVVALGADPGVGEDMSHWEGDFPPNGKRVTVPALTKDELVGLADRLGG